MEIDQHPPPALFLFYTTVTIIHTLITPVSCGCYANRLCCPGRNHTCVALETGPNFQPSSAHDSPGQRRELTGRPDLNPTSTSTTARPQVSTSRGPWHVHVDSFTEFESPTRAGGTKNYFNYFQNRNRHKSAALTYGNGPGIGSEFGRSVSYDQSFADVKDYFNKQDRQPISKPDVVEYAQPHRGSPNAGILTAGQFGANFQTLAPPKNHNRPILRYQIVEDHVVAYGKKIGNLEVSRTAKICYCDEVCRKLGDCCSDFESICPVSDCHLSEWSQWGPCEVMRAEETAPSYGELACGPGVSMRFREVIHPPQHGGEPCPEIEEQRTCFQDKYPCSSYMKEVALILPYEFTRARAPGYRPDQFGHLLHSQQFGLSERNDHCLVFRVTWVTAICAQDVYRAHLQPDSRVCVECQATAYQQNQNRCTGEGIKSIETLWKAANPVQAPHCFGLWTQEIQSAASCRCASSFPELTAFIFV